MSLKLKKKEKGMERGLHGWGGWSQIDHVYKLLVR